MSISKRSLEGYLMVDNSHAPGPTLEQIRDSGKDVAAAGVRGLFESATVTCCHCGTIVVLNPNRSRPRNHCRKCDAYVCDSPTCNFECKPLAQLLDEIETSNRRASIIL